MILDKNTEFHVNLPSEELKNPTLLLAGNDLNALFRRRFGKGENPRFLDVVFSLATKNTGYSVSASEKTLEFHGETPIHLLHAVYAFAEKLLDYCFFEPGNDTLASSGGQLSLSPGELIQSTTPRFKRRGFIQEFPFSPDSFRLADWMAKNRLNYLLTWMKHYDTITPEIREAFHIRGIEIESGHHNFNYWIPGKTHTKSHPEFFALRNGARIKPSAHDSALLLSEQLCTTNPKLREEIVNRMLAYAERHPELRTLSLIPNDGFGWCECERCAELYDPAKKGHLHSVSEHVYDASIIYHDLITDVAEQLRRRNPDLKLTFCAYVNYTRPAPGFRLAKNLCVHFAPYWRCVNHDIADADCWINADYCRDLAAWQAVKEGGEINIYEYLMGVNLYASLPLIIHETIFDEASHFTRMGADGYLTQFHLTHWAAYGINYYMMARALHGEDRKTSLEEFFQKIFGTRAGQARQFYDKLRSIQQGSGPHLITYPRALFSRTKIGDFRKAHEMARQLADGATHDFIRALPLWTEYLLRFKELFDRYHAGQIGHDDIAAFQDWCRPLENHGILVFDKLRMLLEAWDQSLRDGREWLHFNIDWEDNYIRRHDHLLGKSKS